MNRKRKRRPTILVYALVVFVFSMIAFTFTSIYLKQYNTDITVEIQSKELIIKSEQAVNEALQVEIDKLTTRTKVADVIADENMEHNKDNIIYVPEADE